MELILDSKILISRASVHDYFAEKLEFPDYYGRNLDALYDLLSEFSAQLSIYIVNREEILDALNGYGRSLVCTIQDAAAKNPNLSVKFSNSCENIENNS